MDKLNLYAGDNTLDIELKRLTRKGTGAVIVDATVTCTITDMSDVEITGVPWPVTMTHVNGGDYAGVISADADIVVGIDYKVKVNVTDVSNKGEWVFITEAKIRPFV